MKQTIFAMLAALLLACAGCMTNEGNIGDIYGVWMIEDLTIDGTEADFDLSSYSFRFQGQVVQIFEQQPHGEYELYTGTWEKTDNVLTLIFKHANLPPELGLPKDTTSELGIEALSGKQMVLTYATESGRAYRYVLRKSI